MHGLLLSQSWPRYGASRVHTGYAFRTQRLHRSPGIEQNTSHRRQELGERQVNVPPATQNPRHVETRSLSGKTVKGRSLIYDLEKRVKKLFS